MDVATPPPPSASKVFSHSSEWLKQKFIDLVYSPRTQAQKRTRQLEELSLDSQPTLAPSARATTDSSQHAAKQRRLLPQGTPRYPGALHAHAAAHAASPLASPPPPLAAPYGYGATYRSGAAAPAPTPWTPSQAFSPLRVPTREPQRQRQQQAAVAYRWSATPPAKPKPTVQYSSSYVTASPHSRRPGQLDARPYALLGGGLRHIESSALAELERMRRTPRRGGASPQQQREQAEKGGGWCEEGEETERAALMAQLQQKHAQVQRITEEDEQRQRARVESSYAAALLRDAGGPQSSGSPAAALRTPSSLQPPAGSLSPSSLQPPPRARSTPSTPRSSLNRSSGPEAADFDALVRKAAPTHVEAANSQGRDREILLLEERQRIEEEVRVLGAEIFAAHIRETDEPEEEEAEEEAEDPLLLPLTEEQEQRVDDALGPGNGSEILATSPFTNIEVRRKDMACLKGLGWLNDEVINYYMGMLQERELRNNPGKPKSHFCNTFFYAKLAGDNGYKYKDVRRWTGPKKLGKYASILECDKIVVPIHQGIHWVLGVIHLKEQRLEFFDSMGGSDQGALANLARYVADEFLDKREQTVDTTGWAVSSPKDIPHQQNCSDCGVFMSVFANFVSRDAQYEFGQAHMPAIRRKFVASILDDTVA